MQTLMHFGGAFLNVVSYTGLDPVVQLVKPATSTEDGHDNPAAGINLHPKRAEIQALIQALNDALVNSETADETEASIQRSPARGDIHLLAVLRELLDSSLAPMPPYEAGKEAQDAWADRRAAARNNASAIFAKTLESAHTRDCSDARM